MRSLFKLFVFFTTMLLLSAMSYGQSLSPIGSPGSGAYSRGIFKTDSGLYVTDTGNFTHLYNRTKGIAGVGSSFFFHNGTNWINITGGGGSADSLVYQTNYRADTGRTNFYKTIWNVQNSLDSVDAVLFEQISDLSTSVDTMRGNLWPVINSKANSSALANYLLISDSSIYQPKYRSDTARNNLWPAINSKGTGTVSSIRFVGGTGITVSPTTAITSTGVVTITGTAGTVTSVGTSFGLSGGTITTSGTLLVDTTNVPTQYRVDTASRNARIVALSRGTVSSIATGFGLSGGTITTSGTLIVDTTNVPTQYRVDTASRNARTVALGRVSSVSGTSGRISSTGGTTPVLDLVTVNATPATYGGSNAIPVVAVDAYGRATSITTVTPVTTTAITTTNFTTSYTIAATDSRPILLTITAQAGDLTFNAPTGLTDGQLILIRIKATGSSRALTWNAAFGAIAGPTAVALPTSVATTTWTTLQFIYNSTDTKTYLTGYVTN